MKILLAKTAGFCYGVRRAVNLALKAAETEQNCVTLGPIIHNRSVVEELREKGVREVESPADCSSGDTVIIRSHGVGRQEYAQLAALGVKVLDATCPDVAAIHRRVEEESAAGRTILIIGQKDHPEVMAIADRCARSFAAETPEEWAKWIESGQIPPETPVSIVSQTTESEKNFEGCVNFLKKQYTNCKIFDTMCSTTAKRQEEAAVLSHKCGAMIVIGGRHSANSRKLAEICRENCPLVRFVETAEELEVSEFADVEVLGITAGASTPAWIIKEVYHKMSDEIKAVDTTVTPEPEVPAEEESFEAMLENSIKTLYTGEKVTGTVVAITPTEVSVELGTKHYGYIPIAELSSDPDAKPEDVVKIGDEIETYVMRVNDVEGTAMLSKKRLDSVKIWDDINAARESREIVEGVVTEENKGGVVVNVKGVRVFVPASQSGLPKDTPMTELVKTKVRLRITEVNQSRRRVVGSIRAVQYEERRARAEAIWNEIEVGKRYKGVVKSLTSYGAFVDIGGIDGMVHVSELSWRRIHQPSEVVSVGDEIEVYVISFDPEKKKISLGYKDKSENPWVKFTEAYSVGSVADVRIAKLMDFGAFAEIIPGVDGLIHISQIADHRIGKPDEVLTVGETVKVKIIDINNETQKVSLSIRALLNKESEPAPETAEDEPAAEAADAPEAAEEAPAEAEAE